jgi:anti-sigma factor RsiW
MTEQRDPWTTRLSEYVDGELPADTRAELERHLVACGDCRVAVSDLRRVRDLAAALADVEPSRDLWPGIGARIGAARPADGVLPLHRRWVFTLPQLAAAAALLLAVGAGSAAVAFRGGRRAAREGRPPALAVTAAAPATAPVAFTGTESLNQATANLERLLAEHRDRLDTATVRVLEQSLKVIDHAIAEAQAALAADPNDPYLNAHLAETMRRKVTLMRRAATLLAAS